MARTGELVDEPAVYPVFLKARLPLQTFQAEGDRLISAFRHAETLPEPAREATIDEASNQAMSTLSQVAGNWSQPEVQSQFIRGLSSLSDALQHHHRSLGSIFAVVQDRLVLGRIVKFVGLFKGVKSDNHQACG